MSDTHDLDSSESATARKCIATGEVLEPNRLIRFVVGPEDVVVPDILGKLPGRGMWVRADRACIDKACAAKAFARAAKKKVSIPDGLADQVDTSVGGTALPLTDSDLDGTLPDFLDLDSDADGIPDAVEANDGMLPANMDTDGQFSTSYAQANDTDRDGIINDVDTNNGGTQLANNDADGDGTTR